MRNLHSSRTKAASRDSKFWGVVGMKHSSARRIGGIVATLLLASTGSVGGVSEPAQDREPTPPVEVLVARLEDRETAWAATTYLQADSDDAAPLLLQPGLVTFGAHGRWGGPMLALAKLGKPAIPSILDRITAILRGPNSEIAGALPLIEVLGSMGPATIPVLLQIAESGESPVITFYALNESVRMEPTSIHFGNDLSPWYFWRPADDRLVKIGEQLTPLLPRLERVLEQAVRRWTPGFPPPQRPAAYLLARWGEGSLRTLGLHTLDELARVEDFSQGLDAVRLLHALKAPQTPALIRLAAMRVPEDDSELRGHHFLTLAVALRQLRESEYADFLDIPLNDRRPDVRMDAARFVASTGAIPNAALLLPLLDDRTDWGGRTVAEVAHESLERLTVQELAPEEGLWRAWLEETGFLTRREALKHRLVDRAAGIRTVPIWEANRWIDGFVADDGPLILPVIDEYLRRPDLNSRAVGPDRELGSVGDGPIGLYGPRVVSLLLEMIQQGVPGARKRLESCLEAADPEVRIFGALALAAYDRSQAVEQLAKEARMSDGWHRNRASEFLLRLGDRRGVPARLQALGSEVEYTRLSACRDLRVYSQQALPCDAHVWRDWWRRNEPTFRVRVREAGLDLKVFPTVSQDGIGGRTIGPP
jgi:hypothetical protein